MCVCVCEDVFVFVCVHVCGSECVFVCMCECVWVNVCIIVRESPLSISSLIKFAAELKFNVEADS